MTPGLIVDTHAWLTGKAPTREEVVGELGRYLQTLRAAPVLSDERKLQIDCVQTAHDLTWKLLGRDA